ncbi:group I truncated hemoglobin [Halomonas sp. M4R1S46]|uniref:group I truncated hemoglobin n=1 Tax=Halomonas sp. M4R1S46 TaxID=2982692 RepID=UPI0021E4199E|nr:group 1 truncated hemoglobin [Halomonas sp. M4R1S46]UYG08316.1 group 1 truncated hemoglobin [Halomonas sp. M4R1S46]
MIKRSGYLGAGLAIVLMMAAGMAQAQEDAEASLYDRLGGLTPISVVVSDFIDVLLVDDVLNANPAIDEARQRVPAPYLKYRVTSLVCQAAGGPCEYQGRSMQASHAHLNITEAEWAQMVTLLEGVLDEHGVPDRETEELLAIVGSTKEDIVTVRDEN